MSVISNVVPGTAAESASIAKLVADSQSAKSSRIRATTELAVAVARLAAIRLTLIVLTGTLSALFVFGAWSL